MNTTDIIIISVIAFLCNLFVMYLIIKWATRANEQVAYLEIQARMLRKLCIKLGIPEYEVNEVWEG